MKDWDYDEIDYLRLMKAYLENRVDVDAFRRELFSMNAKRSHLSEEASLIIQKAYGRIDDYDPVARLEHTIEEPELRELIAASAKQLEELGYRIEE
jgi:hypothetical protein